MGRDGSGQGGGGGGVVGWWGWWGGVGGRRAICTRGEWRHFIKEPMETESTMMLSAPATMHVPEAETECIEAATTSTLAALAAPVGGAASCGMRPAGWGQLRTRAWIWGSISGLRLGFGFGLGSRKVPPSPPRATTDGRVLRRAHRGAGRAACRRSGRWRTRLARGCRGDSTPGPAGC